MSRLAMFFLLFLFSYQGQSNASGIDWQSQFGLCPSKVANGLSAQLQNAYNKNRSLKDLKDLILRENLFQKNFLSSYKITYHPFKQQLMLNFNCPRPLARVQIYRRGGQEDYRGILVENGKIFGPAYFALLKQEEKIKSDLPSLALPQSRREEQINKDFAEFINGIDEKFRQNISEMILNEESELTVILSIEGATSSAFLGKADWKEKIEKLKNIFELLALKKRIPTFVNLTNSKKVVVKFSDSF